MYMYVLMLAYNRYGVENECSLDILRQNQLAT